MNKILVTGCSGYIGGNLIPHLKSNGFKIFGIDRKPCTATELDNFWQGDILDEKILKQSLDGVNSVFHLAASKDDWGLTDREYFRDNFDATRQLLHIAREKHVKNFLFYSSVSVMGPSSVPLDEHIPFSPKTTYGKSKADAEKLFHQFAKEDAQAQIVILRPSVVFGPGNPKNTNIYRFIDAIYKDRFFMIGNGEVTKTTSYIENVVAATIFLIHRMHKGGTHLRRDTIIPQWFQASKAAAASDRHAVHC